MSQGGPKPSSFYVERQIATRLPATPAAPSGLDSNHAAGQNDPGPGAGTTGDGLILAGLMAVTVSIWPQSGLTLTGGTLLCWLYNPYIQAWSRCPDFDLPVTAATYTGPAGYTFSSIKNLSRLGFLMNFLTSSLTGTSPDFLIRLDGFQSVLGMGA